MARNLRSRKNPNEVDLRIMLVRIPDRMTGHDAPRSYTVQVSDSIAPSQWSLPW